MNYKIDDDKSHIDHMLVHQWLQHCYWSENIPKNIVAKMIKNSYCVGAYLSNSMIAFCRAITDYCTFVYLCDLYVDKKHRRKGVASNILQYMLHTKGFIHYKRLLLIATEESKAMYLKLGFQEIHNNKLHLEICNLSVYKK